MKEVNHRVATLDDSSLLADLNRQFLLEKGHRNVFLPDLGSSPDAIPIAKLEERMRWWLGHAYSGVLFTDQRQVLAYALYREDDYEVELPSKIGG